MCYGLSSSPGRQALHVAACRILRTVLSNRWPPTTWPISSQTNIRLSSNGLSTPRSCIEPTLQDWNVPGDTRHVPSSIGDGTTHPAQQRKALQDAQEVIATSRLSRWRPVYNKNGPMVSRERDVRAQQTTDYEALLEEDDTISPPQPLRVAQKLAMTREQQQWRQAQYLNRFGHILKESGRQPFVDQGAAWKLSLLEILLSGGYRAKLSPRKALAVYLEHRMAKRADEEKEPASISLPDQYTKYLAEQGYTIEDVSVWADFGLAEKPLDALRIYQEYINTSGGKDFPLPILAFFGRRQELSFTSLNAYLGHLRLAFTRYHDGIHRQGLVMMLFARLVRHARRSCPELLKDITDFLLENLYHYPDPSHRILQERSRILARAMSLLSLPTTVRPYESSSVQEDAIIKILQFMVDHQPILQMNREGYRAIVRIQLRLPKSKDEQKWAVLKSLSWPPWKRDRTAMDSELGPEFGMSKARQSMQRMFEAGFRAQAWDTVASIYSGWDEDGTPTIQTRKILGYDKQRLGNASANWAARIECTRTIQEAWACWLSYEEHTPLARADTAVVQAILTKLHLEHERSRRTHPSQRTEEEKSLLVGHVPGDGKEIYAPPSSIHLHTFTRTQPPSVHEFFCMLRDQDTRISLDIADTLIQHADSLQHAFEYLLYLDKDYPGISSMMVNDVETHFEHVPAVLTHSIVAVLCRYGLVPMKLFNGSVVSDTHIDKSTVDLHIPFQHSLLKFDIAFVRAVWLLKQAKIKRTRYWRPVFQFLDKHGPRLEQLTTMDKMDRKSRNHNSRLERQGEVEADLRNSRRNIQCLRIMQQLIGLMAEQKVPIDLEIFRMVCHAVNRAGYSCLFMSNKQYMLESKDHSAHHRRMLEVHKELERVKEEHLGQWLESLYKQLAGSVEHIASPDELAKGPKIEPTLLHVWIRALGWLGKHNAILQLVKNICLGDGIVTRLDAPGDVRGIHLCITALRVFLERSWLERSGEDASVAGAASEAIVNEVRELIEGKLAADFGGWASDMEVQKYCEDKNFANLRR